MDDLLREWWGATSDYTGREYKQNADVWCYRKWVPRWLALVWSRLPGLIQRVTRPLLMRKRYELKGCWPSAYTTRTR